MTKHQSVNMTEGVIWKQILMFSIPLICTTILQRLYSAVDSIVVGNFAENGKVALAAIGSTEQFINLFVSFAVGISTGVCIIVAQFYGANDTKNINKAVHTAISFAIIGGLVLTLISYFTTNQILQIVNIPDDVYNDAKGYIQVYFYSLTVVMLYTICSAILRAIGDSRRPLIYLIISFFINIFVDLLLVKVFHFGVLGAAWATLFSQTTSAVLALIRLLTVKDIYRLKVTQLKINLKMLWRIIKIGVPAAIQSITFNLSNIIIQSQINTFGSAAVAGCSSCSKIENFILTPAQALSLSATTFVGQNIGARKYSRVHKSVKVCFAMAFSVTVLLSALVLLFRQPLMMIFTREQEVLHYGLSMMMVLAPCYIFHVPTEVLTGVIRGTGTVLPPMLTTMIGICLTRIIWIMTLVPIFKDIRLVFWCYPASWVITSTAMLIYYFKGKWMYKDRLKALRRIRREKLVNS